MTWSKEKMREYQRDYRKSHECKAKLYYMKYRSSKNSADNFTIGEPRHSTHICSGCGKPCDGTLKSRSGMVCGKCFDITVGLGKG